MKTLDCMIRESQEFVCEAWGQGEAVVSFYAPVTRVDGMTWIHPAWAREFPWQAITRRSTRIWQLSGSFWNPGSFRLIWQGEPVFAVPGEPEGGSRA